MFNYSRSFFVKLIKSTLPTLFIWSLECWKGDPDKRPDIRKIVLTLEEIIFPKKDDDIVDIVEEMESHSSKNSISSSNNGSSDIMDDIVMSFDNCDIDQFQEPNESSIKGIEYLVIWNISLL